ncbi:MAG: hypothetical protein AAF580_07315 [Pseudomonadota bacterium]
MRCMLAAGVALSLAFSAPADAYRASTDTVPIPGAADLDTGADDADNTDADENWLFDPHSDDGDTTRMPPVTGFSSGDVRYGDTALPAPVSATRAALMEAARSGNIEALRPVFNGQRGQPLVVLDGMVDDPVEHLKLQSGDAAGQEILAILLEILESGYVKDGNGPTASYVWPFFALVPLTELRPSQRVDVYRLLTSIDVEEMELFGAYTFFRVVIAEDGRLRYFAAGEWE